MTLLKSRFSTFLIFAFWAVLIACGGGGGGGNTNSTISFTSTGHQVYPNLNGAYSYSDGSGGFQDATVDNFYFDYNFDSNGNPRVTVQINTPVGVNLAAGQTYQYANSGTGWNFGTAQSLTDPNPDNHNLLYGGVGTLTVNSVTNNADGSKTVSYTFSLAPAGQAAPSRGNAEGLTTSGSGTCTVVPFT